MEIIENYKKLITAMCVESIKVMFNGFNNKKITNKARKEYLEFRELFVKGSVAEYFSAAGFTDLYIKVHCWYVVHETLDESRRDFDLWKEENGIIFGRRTK